MTPPPPDRLGAVARTLLAARAPDASICPSDVVRRLWRDTAPAEAPPDGWRAWMPAVRAVAADLAAAGILRITRGAEDVAPDAARDGGGGPLRLRRGPRFDPPDAPPPPAGPAGPGA